VSPGEGRHKVMGKAGGVVHKKRERNKREGGAKEGA